jgi:lysophospholipase L1-like esterase
MVGFAGIDDEARAPPAPGSRRTVSARARRAWPRVALLFAGSLAAGLLVLEGVLRLFHPQLLLFDTSAVWEPAEGLGVRRRPLLDTRVNTGEREVRVRSDAARHRVGAAGPRDGARRILAVGDSMVEALQVEHEQTMTALAGDALGRALGEAVDVVNAGLGGYEPSHYVMVVREELAAGPCDLAVVFVFLENDVVERRTARFPPSARLGDRGPAASADGFLRRRSHLYVFVRNLRELRRTRAGAPRRHLLTNAERAHAGDQAWAATVGILAEAAEEARRRSVPVLFVLLPPRQYVDEEDLGRMLWAFGLQRADVDPGQPARLLAEGLRARGLDVFDASPALEAAVRAGEPDLYGRVDRHLGPAGHRVLARALVPVLAARLRGGRG